MVLDQFHRLPSAIPSPLSERTITLRFPDKQMEIIVYVGSQVELESRYVDTLLSEVVLSFRCRLRVPNSDLLSNAAEMWSAGNPCNVCYGDVELEVDEMIQKRRWTEIQFMYHFTRNFLQTA